jgi:DNA polymerase (family X)
MNLHDAQPCAEAILIVRVRTTARPKVSPHSLPLEDLIRQERPRDIPGVGDAIADIITTLHTTGTHLSLDAMPKEVPAGVLDFLPIPGVRPDKALKLYNQLGVRHSLRSKRQRAPIA